MIDSLPHCLIASLPHCLIASLRQCHVSVPLPGSGRPRNGIRGPGGGAQRLRKPAGSVAVLSGTGVASCGGAMSIERQAYARWVQAMAGAIAAPHDPRTLELWARELHTSVG